MLSAISIGVYWTVGWLQLLIFTVAAAWAFAYRARHITYPTTWFVPVFFLYSVSLPFLALSGRAPYDQYTAQLLPLHVTALIGFVLGIGTDSARNTEVQITYDETIRYLLCWVGLISAWILVALSLPLVAKLGITGSKEEMIAAARHFPVLRLDAMALPAIVFSVYIVAARLVKGKRNWIIIIPHLAAFVGIIALSGRRLLLIKFVVAVLLVYMEIRNRREPNLKTPIIAYLVGACIFFSLPFLQYFKYTAIRGGFEYSYDVWELIALEFRSMSFNLYHVLAEGLENIFNFGDTLLMDLGSILSSQLLNVRISEGIAVWYNDNIWSELTVGRGFSLVAEGYLNGGFAGVFVTYLVLGAITRYVYINRTRSLAWLVFWVNYVPTLLYAQRQDLALYVSVSLKTVLMPLGCIVLGAHFLQKWFKKTDTLQAVKDTSAVSS
jgi:oligosaccharide repeat unit polymerase